mmetsp:Transcript_40519/g.127621  ORF Transcript_40519/g.127621 Transcript_40519/m.127621 type:complete len:153 (+) Transcript_40519:178-636(+)
MEGKTSAQAQSRFSLESALPAMRRRVSKLSPIGSQTPDPVSTRLQPIHAVKRSVKPQSDADEDKNDARSGVEIAVPWNWVQNDGKRDLRISAIRVESDTYVDKLTMFVEPRKQEAAPAISERDPATARADSKASIRELLAEGTTAGALEESG